MQADLINSKRVFISKTKRYNKTIIINKFFESVKAAKLEGLNPKRSNYDFYQKGSSLPYKIVMNA